MPAPSDPLSPLIELELELEAAAETERNILEQLQSEIAALERAVLGSNRIGIPESVRF
jgi:hypothetical protein